MCIRDSDLADDEKKTATDTWNLLPKLEQDKCVTIVTKLHRNMNHGAIRTMVIALKKKKSHWGIIHAAENFKCETCEMAKRKLLAPVSSGMANEPGKVDGTDNFYWTHPKGHRSVRGQIFVDCGSDVVQV